MDIATRKFYARDAAACAARYEDADVGALHDVLRPLAKNNLHVLDIGGGSGRDAAFLIELGCRTTYTDGCQEMVDQAVRFHPELAENARLAVFPLSEDDPLLSERYELVLCVAVIMHLGDTCLKTTPASVLAKWANVQRLAKPVADFGWGVRGIQNERSAVMCGKKSPRHRFLGSDSNSR